MADITLTGDTTLSIPAGGDNDLLDEIELRSKRTVAPRRTAQPPPESGLDAFSNPSKRVSFADRPPPEDDYDEEDEGSFDDDDFSEQPSGPQPSAGYSSIEDEKADLLNKLARLEKKGFKTSATLTAYSEIEQIRTEYKRIMFQIESDQGIKFARRILMACVTGLEFVNKKFDPFDVQLDGWSENMMENIDDYDTVFEDLHAKYKNKIAVAPEVKLIMMVGGSAMMFHLTNSMFKSAGLDTGKVLKENPDLLKNMMDAVKRSQEAPPPRDTGDGRREMRGPGIDLGSMMGGFMPPPPTTNSRPVFREAPPAPASAPSEDGDLSDIISVNSDTKDFTVKTGTRKSSKKKKEVTL